ncbi:MAG: hypothetical protein ABSG76_06770 [Xanthobacteraceae bacterium]|jgi:hypothetical protein
MDWSRSSIVVPEEIQTGEPSAVAAKRDIARDIVAKLRAAGMPCELVTFDDEAEDDLVRQ